MSPLNFEPIGQCTRRVHRKTPTGADYKRGIAFGDDNTDPEKAALAGSTKFEGFLSRDAVQARSLRDLLHPDSLLESPTISGEMATLEDFDEIEAEGTDFLVLTGTGVINSSAGVGTKLGFDGNGKLRVAQPGDNYYFEVTANSAVSSSAFPSRNGELRIRARRTSGHIPSP